ncbi:KAP family P-loop NTPase fold protein [Vogesella urethralis]|uniref:KAP family P-loop NTPase fold protein n=1 Tax=Vogesella urethralis TaxID=2592656 RepID=UPI001185977A|nr:P-loop NTPase fold protein [Vogesella urethralis]
MTDTATDLPKLLTDAPAKAEEDLLGFQPHADRLADLILKQIPNKASFVIGIEGEWGEGKSSFINLLKDAFPTDDTRPTIVDFNPWWFEGSDQLLRHFFDELLGQIDRSGRWTAPARKFMRGLAGLLDGGGKAAQLVSDPGVIAAGKTAEKAGGLLKKLGGEKTRSAQVLKASSKHVLEAQRFKTVVFIDDLDRLPAREIVELFRVIKAVADLPNIVYVIAYDRAIVASALDEIHPGRGGEAYLEKIVQLPYRLPKPTEEKLESYNKNALFGSGAVSAVVPEKLEAEMSFRYISQAFLKLPRDVKRLQGSLCAFGLVPETIRMDPLDFMFLEALRIKEHVLWLQLTSAMLEAHSYMNVAEGTEKRDVARKDWLRKRLPALIGAEVPVADAIRFFTGWVLDGNADICRDQSAQRLSRLSTTVHLVQGSHDWQVEIDVLLDMVRAYLQQQQDKKQFSNEKIRRYLMAGSVSELAMAQPGHLSGRFLYGAENFLNHGQLAEFDYERHLRVVAMALEQEIHVNHQMEPSYWLRLLYRHVSLTRHLPEIQQFQPLAFIEKLLAGGAPLLITWLTFSSYTDWHVYRERVIAHHLMHGLADLLILPDPVVVASVLKGMGDTDQEEQQLWNARLPSCLDEDASSALQRIFEVQGSRAMLESCWLTACPPFVALVRQLPRPESGPVPWDAFLQKATV